MQNNTKYLNSLGISNEEEEFEEQMASIGKYLAYLLGFFVVAFLILSFFNPNFIDKFIDWTLKIVYAIVGGTVIYIIVKIINKVK